MRAASFTILYLTAALVLSGCSAGAVGSLEGDGEFKAVTAAGSAAEGGAEAAYRKISAKEAKEMMDGAGEFTLLDVRTDEEFEEKHIGSAVLIPDFELAERAEAELPGKSALILVYCRSGRRSESSARLLADMGYTNVYDLGGIIDWPYETAGE